MADNRRKSIYWGSGQITREQFYFYEMRITARLIEDGLEEAQIIEKIVDENLFQFPTERTIKSAAKACVKRLNCLHDSDLVKAVALNPADDAKQICLYAMMKRYQLVWDFMITVIGAKYQNLDLKFSKMDVNVFMMRLQEQDDLVASWSEKTIDKIKQVLIKILVENDYLDSVSEDHLNPVLISSFLESKLRQISDTKALLAFNCLS